MSEEEIDQALNKIENEMVQILEDSKALTNQDDKWFIQQINTKKHASNGQLVYPKYDKKSCYYQEFWKVFLLNEILIAKVKDFSNTNKKLSGQIQQVDDLQKQWTKIWGLKTKKKLRRTSDMIDKNFTCPFERCGKNYGSDVALNMHMKLKHKSGTKTEREMLAKEVCLAEERGEKVSVNLNFPPGYLEEFRENFRRENKQ